LEVINWKAAQQSYSSLPQDIGEWKLELSTPTLLAYRNGLRILLSVRGTQDFKDVIADAMLAASRVTQTQRFATDKAAVDRVVAQFPPHTFAYFATGHSLGSAIGLALQRAFPFIRSAVYFNGALQPSDVWSQQPNTKQVYNERDPLYRLVGRWWRNKQVVNATDMSGKWLSDGLAAHKLLTFSRLYGAALKSSSPADAQEYWSRIISTPLSDSDLRSLLGENIRVVTYPQLESCTTIADALDDTGRCIILFLTESSTSGHWTCVHTTGPTSLEYFDPYGLKWDVPFEWLSDEQERALGQTRHSLSRLFAAAQREGVNVTHNSTQFQAKGDAIASCGRWCAARLLMGDLTLPQFTDVVKRSNVPPDQFVAVVTDTLAHLDTDDEDEDMDTSSDHVYEPEYKRIKIE
jgi:hypothetical protein